MECCILQMEWVVYPRKKPEYPVAFIYDSEVLDEIPEVPAWAIRYLMDDV